MPGAARTARSRCSAGRREVISRAATGLLAASFAGNGLAAHRLQESGPPAA